MFSPYISGPMKAPGRSVQDAGERCLGGSQESQTGVLWQKVIGGWRPVISLSYVTKYVNVTNFRMETISLAFGSIRKGDVMLSYSFEDTCFQIPIHPDS